LRSLARGETVPVHLVRAGLMVGCAKGEVN